MISIQKQKKAKISIKKKRSLKRFEKDFYKLRNNLVFGKAMDNVRHGDIKFIKTEKRRKNLLAIEMNKAKLNMKKQST